MNYWKGLEWNWVDQGQPPGTTMDGAPGAITYREGTNPQRIYVFVGGENKHLYVNYWNGANWNWVAQGGTVSGSPAVITYREGTQPQCISAFISHLRHLHMNHWDGAQWHWSDLGKPPFDFTGHRDFLPGVVTYVEGVRRRIHVFVPDPPGNQQSEESNHAVGWARLHANDWNGSQWTWVNHGKAANIAVGEDQPIRPGVVSFSEGGTQRIYVFLPLSKGNYQLRRWDGTQWKWEQVGGAAMT